jgi:uncharacterized protein involved in exopolysaccharide biosynthesis
MLQNLPYQEQSTDEVHGSFLTPAYLYDVLKRRIVIFLISFVLILAIGSLVTLLLPATYYAEGKILVESQQIPLDLVRPTVTAQANERMQVMEQRIMAREYLLEIAKKYQLYSGRQRDLSGTQMLNFMRRSTKIEPLALKLPTQSFNNRQVIGFTVGFEHERPLIAERVANELITVILAEDARTRSNFASETTRFLDREAKRLETALSATELQISELKKRQAGATDDISQKQLLALRSEFLMKSATYSASHPDIKALKAKLDALEQTISPTTDQGLGLEAIERQRDSLKKDLESTTQKLAAARLGESLERGQQSEKLQIIEQPTLPQIPIKPNRVIIFAVAFAFAVMSGAVVVYMLEATATTIHQPADIFRLIDSHLVVTIPYITTLAETRRQKSRMKIVIGLAVVILLLILVVIAAVAYWFPEVSPLIDKIRLRLVL